MANLIFKLLNDSQKLAADGRTGIATKEKEHQFDYEALEERRQVLFEQLKSRKNDYEKETKIMMEMDCIDHFFGAGGLDNYETAASFCVKHDIKRVVDIGCAFGHQSDCFIQQGVEYTGVEARKETFWNADKCHYIQGQYPCDIPTHSDDLAVSVLCLGWSCYLLEGEKSLLEQFEALQRDFSHALLYVPSGVVDTLKNYFRHVEVMEGGFVYCSNR